MFIGRPAHSHLHLVLQRSAVEGWSGVVHRLWSGARRRRQHVLLHCREPSRRRKLRDCQIHRVLRRLLVQLTDEMHEVQVYLSTIKHVKFFSDTETNYALVTHILFRFGQRIECLGKYLTIHAPDASLHVTKTHRFLI